MYKARPPVITWFINPLTTVNQVRSPLSYLGGLALYMYIYIYIQMWLILWILSTSHACDAARSDGFRLKNHGWFSFLEGSTERDAHIGTPRKRWCNIYIYDVFPPSFQVYNCSIWGLLYWSIYIYGCNIIHYSPTWNKRITGWFLISISGAPMVSCDTLWYSNLTVCY